MEKKVAVWIGKDWQLPEVRRVEDLRCSSLLLLLAGGIRFELLGGVQREDPARKAHVVSWEKDDVV